MRLPIFVKKEDVETSQPERLNRKEITGEDLVCVLTHKLEPVAARSSNEAVAIGSTSAWTA